VLGLFIAGVKHEKHHITFTVGNFSISHGKTHHHDGRGK
jgi:hypothetical protein